MQTPSGQNNTDAVPLGDSHELGMAGDALAVRSFAYWTWTFDHFLNEAKKMWAKRKVDDGPAEENPDEPQEEP